MKNFKIPKIHKFSNSISLSIFFCIFLFTNFYFHSLTNCKSLKMTNLDKSNSSKDEESDESLIDFNSDSDVNEEYDNFVDNEDLIDLKLSKDEIEADTNPYTKKMYNDTYKETNPIKNSSTNSNTTLSDDFLNEKKMKIENLKQVVEKYKSITDRIKQYKNLTIIDNNSYEKYIKSFNKPYLITEQRPEKFSYLRNNSDITIKTNHNSSQFISNMTQSQSNHNIYTNYTYAESLMASIESQTQFIKKEICVHSFEISEALDVLIAELNEIESSISELRKNDQKSVEIIINSINKINIVKADISRLNEIISTIQKVNCPSVILSQKKIELILHSVNKLIESITEKIKNLKLNLNLVILT